MLILQEAERAKEIAKILSTSLIYSNPESRTAIETTINRLDELSLIFRDLDMLLEHQDGITSRTFADDLELLQNSVSCTLGDLWTILGALPDQTISHDYRATWKEIVAHYRNTRNESLHMTIEIYNSFALALCKILRR